MTALVVGVLVALLFTACCVGVAMLVLLPVLMITTFLGVAACGWGWVGWFVLKWFGMVNSGGSSGGGGDDGRGNKQGGENNFKVEDGQNGVK